MTDDGTHARSLKVSVANTKMQFVLVGFSQHMGFRTFAFEGIAADRTRTPYTVKADLALIGTYGIRMQELPLLCRELLERYDEREEQRSITFSEEEMRVHASNCTAARETAMQKKKSSRRSPPVPTHGATWPAP